MTERPIASQEEWLAARSERLTTADATRSGRASEAPHDPRRSLQSHRVLGRSGLRVSPAALGTMTFGPDWGWGAERKEAQRMFDAYVDRGGNFIDSASTYTDGTAERFVGEFAAGRRDRLVIATKYAGASRTDDPNSAASNRKSMVLSIERSLRALQTDYIDLLYLHAWDGLTPVEEILRAMDDLVSAGKVLYLGIANMPAWQASRMQAIAELRGWTPPVALQIEYSLLERTAERDLIPMAREMGLGVIACSPLGSGVLTGKYGGADLGPDGPAEPAGTRKSLAAASGALSERGLAIAKVVGEVAGELGTTAARVALAWTLSHPAVTAPVIGARTLAQLEDDLNAIELELSSSQRTRLIEASAIELGLPHEFLARRSTIAASTGGGRSAGRL
jgi:aryl-alcohol dehydrogenase-like predicted oxidoreductase